MDNQTNQYNVPLPQQPLPNATAALVLGIISIVGCFCYGIVGVICGIVALVLGNKAIALYKAQPDEYTIGSYSNAKAGRVCGIVGLALSAIYLIIIIIAVATIGIAALSNPQEFMNHFNK